MSECCRRCGNRIYYFCTILLLILILIVELITLGTFGRLYVNTRDFFRDHIDRRMSHVCILYGSQDSIFDNPKLTNNGSCAFELWGVVSMIVIFLVWIVYNFILALVGRPPIVSMGRIVDVIASGGTFFLSIIISAIFTDGFTKTCNGFTNAQGFDCSSLSFIGNDRQTFPFYQSLVTARDTAWIVTIILFILFIYYVILFTSHLCMKRREKAAEEKYIAHQNIPAFSEEGEKTPLQPGGVEIEITESTS